MPLVEQRRRRLSPLERYAVDLVFDGEVDPGELWIEIPEIYKVGGQKVAGDGGDIGKIKLSRSVFADAEDLDMLTEVDDIDKTRPRNIAYLSTLVHEAGHYWQERRNRYRERIPFYEFAGPALRSAKFFCAEQHASVGQVYFIVKWQWDLGIPQLDLTDGSPRWRDNVGPVGRYCPIGGRDLDANNKRYMSRDEVGKFFPWYFQKYLIDLNQ